MTVLAVQHHLIAVQTLFDGGRVDLDQHFVGPWFRLGHFASAQWPPLAVSIHDERFHFLSLSPPEEETHAAVAVSFLDMTIAI